MDSDTPRTGRAVPRDLPVLAVIGLAAILATPAAASVTPVSQQRTVSTFALISYPGQEGPFCSDQKSLEEQGAFAETIECHVEEEDGSRATGSAAQLSYIFPDVFLAEGSIQANSDISGAADFAEGLGLSRFVSRFLVDETTEVRVRATLFAGGNGRTNMAFTSGGGEILIQRSLQEESGEVDEVFALDPGTYELTLSASGYGQALPDGGGEDAFGSFSSSIEFPSAGVETPAEAAGRLSPTVAPNPVRDGATLIPSAAADPADREIIVLDLAGRRIRRFPDVGPSGVAWDARDEHGRPVAAGVYWVGGRRGPSTRVVVLR
jgi:hypothetical protein